jgi:hypothetical protein
MRVPAMLGALRERRFRLLWLGQSTSVLAGPVSGAIGVSTTLWIGCAVTVIDARRAVGARRA